MFWKPTRPPPPGPPWRLRVENGRLLAAVGLRRAVLTCWPLLPQAYRGDIEAVEAELDAIVGLEPVKSYLRELAGNVQAQQRRKAQGLPVAEVKPPHDLYRQL